MIFLSSCLPWNLYTSKDFIKKRDPLGHWKNGWIQTPQRVLMDLCIKQARVLSKRFWIIPWLLAYHRLDCIRKIISFWYTFGWKWWVVTIWDYRMHVRMKSMMSSVEWTDLDFKISVALIYMNSHFWCWRQHHSLSTNLWPEKQW